MSISGLVLTLADGPAAAAAWEKLASDPRLEIGERFGRRVAIVAETLNVDGDRALWDELRQDPGITHIDVTYVHLEGDAPGIAAIAERQQEERHVDR